MPTFKQLTTGVLITVVGVFFAGLLMNAMKDMEIVKQAREGFDTGVF